jgi:hypothetical protein
LAKQEYHLLLELRLPSGSTSAFYP